MPAALAIRDSWLPLYVEIEKENEKAKTIALRASSYYQSGPHDHSLHLSEKFFRQIENWHQLTPKFRSADSTKVLLFGEAGNGKSHVLRRWWRRHANRGSQHCFCSVNNSPSRLHWSHRSRASPIGGRHQTRCLPPEPGCHSLRCPGASVHRRDQRDFGAKPLVF